MHISTSRDNSDSEPLALAPDSCHNICEYVGSNTCPIDSRSRDMCTKLTLGYSWRCSRPVVARGGRFHVQRSASVWPVKQLKDDISHTNICGRRLKDPATDIALRSWQRHLCLGCARRRSVSVSARHASLGSSQVHGRKTPYIETIYTSGHIQFVNVSCIRYSISVYLDDVLRLGVNRKRHFAL